MSRKQPCPLTADLLSWEPTEAGIGFEAPAVLQAATLDGQLSRALKLTLAEDGRSRKEIGEAIRTWLGEPVSKDMLDAYVSEGRADVVINAKRLFGMIIVTRDPRVLSLALDPIDMVVIPKKYLPYIKIAQIAEREEEIDAYREELARHKNMLRRQVRS